MSSLHDRMDEESQVEPRFCFREMPNVQLAIESLEQAVDAQIRGNEKLVLEKLEEANLEELRRWTESLWGERSIYKKARRIPGSPPFLELSERAKPRMPSLALRRELTERDGYHCRFCGIPVIAEEVRHLFIRRYPSIWGSKNVNQNAALQAMWLQYDHVLPSARGGLTTIENLVITCAPCNYCRMDKTLEEVGLSDPRLRSPSHTSWDGLTRLIASLEISNL